MLGSLAELLLSAFYIPINYRNLRCKTLAALWTFALGSLLYVLAIGVSLLSAPLALAIYALLAHFYLFKVLPPLK
jgi:hypothetical protein